LFGSGTVRRGGARFETRISHRYLLRYFTCLSPNSLAKYFDKTYNVDQLWISLRHIICTSHHLSRINSASIPPDAVSGIILANIIDANGAAQFQFAYQVKYQATGGGQITAISEHCFAITARSAKSCMGASVDKRLPQAGLCVDATCRSLTPCSLQCNIFKCSTAVNAFCLPVGHSVRGTSKTDERNSSKDTGQYRLHFLVRSIW
jgi:hypothetical protein